MFIQKLIGFVVRNTMVERLSPDSPFLKAVQEDHLVRYRYFKETARNKIVLDIASGEGYGSNLLATVAKKVVGVDLDKDSITRASIKYQKSNIEFFSSDAFTFLQNHKSTYDVIFSFETIEHIRDYQKFIKLIYSCLKPHGIFIVSTPNKKFSDLFTGGTVNPYHVHEFYTQELSDLLEEAFGCPPKLYLQRPVKNQHSFISGIVSLFFKSSTILPATTGFSALDDIFVIQKK